MPLALFDPTFSRPSISVAFHPVALTPVVVDRRWPALAARLTELRAHGRRSVRIVDVACGAGALLLRSAKLARRLGFLAVELRGVDRDARLIHRARVAARAAPDPALGIRFEAGEPAAALLEEAEFPADVVLYPDAADPILAPLAKRGGVTAFALAPERAV